MEALAWFKKYQVRSGVHASDGNVTLPSHFISDPEPCILARELDMTHAKDLTVHFKKYGVLDINVKCLMWEDVAPVLPGLHYDNFSIDISKPTPPKPIMAIIGAHSKEAVKILRGQHPNNPRYKNICVKLAIAPKTQENISYALHLATMDNTIQSLHKSMTMWDCAKQMHRNWLLIQKENPKTQWDAKFTAYRTKSKESMPFKGGSFATLTSFCKHSGEIWNKLFNIFEGKYVKTQLRGQKTPTSLTHFQNMALIPAKDVERWLDRICDGLWTTKDFNLTTAAKNIRRINASKPIS